MSKLYVKVIGCKDLEDKDLKGLSDPYVIVKHGGDHYKTAVCNDNSNPEFNEEFVFEVKDVLNNLIFEVKDSDTFRDELLGFLQISPTNIPKKKSKQTHVLQKVKSGELIIEVNYEGGKGAEPEDEAEAAPAGGPLESIKNFMSGKRKEDREEKKEKKEKKKEEGEDGAEELSEGYPESPNEDDDDETKEGKAGVLGAYLKGHRKEDRAEMSKLKKEEHTKKKEKHAKAKEDGEDCSSSSSSSSSDSSDYDSSDADEEKKAKKLEKISNKDKKKRKKDKKKLREKGEDVSDDSD